MDKNQIKEVVFANLEPYLEGERFLVIDLKITLSRLMSKITLLLDSAEGIKIDECAEISRKLSHDLEEKEIFDGKYTIEVSSPGVDTPLKFAQQYPRNAGRLLRVLLNDGTEKTGKLIEADTEKISIIEDKKRKKGEEIQPITFNFADVKESYVEISFK